jgi:hypothetical protein
MIRGNTFPRPNYSKKPKGPRFLWGLWLLLSGEAYAFTFFAILATVLAKVVI